MNKFITIDWIEKKMFFVNDLLVRKCRSQSISFMYNLFIIAAAALVEYVPFWHISTNENLISRFSIRIEFVLPIFVISFFRKRNGFLTTKEKKCFTRSEHVKRKLCLKWQFVDFLFVWFFFLKRFVENSLFKILKLWKKKTKFQVF